MGQPFRAITGSNRHVDSSTEASALRRASHHTPILAPVPPHEPNPDPRRVRTHKRHLLAMVHPLQIRMLSQVIVYSLIVFVLLAIPIFRPLMQALDNPLLSWQERAVVADDLLSLHARFWPWALAAGVVVLVHSIHSLRLMHRVAGPLYRLSHIFPQIGAGNLAIRATLRQGDYLVPEADLVNQMTAQLQTKINALKHTQVMLALDTRRVMELASTKNDPDLTALAQQLEQNAARLKTSLDTFTTHSG
jgi:hypothetical protein